MQRALLIVDVQQALCTGNWAVADVDAVVDRINEVSRRARAHDVPVFLIQHESTQGALQWRSEGWQICPRLAVDADDMRLRKTASDSFHATELHAILKAKHVSKLVICGMQSEFCVDSTVRGALAYGYSVELVADGHSTLDNGVLTAAQISAHHNLTLQNLTSYGVRAISIAAAQMCFED
jgi:nicotinamidase-related amidase